MARGRDNRGTDPVAWKQEQEQALKVQRKTEEYTGKVSSSKFPLVLLQLASPVPAAAMVKKAVPDVVLDAATLFNLSDLSIHVPPSPLPTPPPSSTTRTVPGISAALEDSQFAAVDDWVGLLAGEKEREEAYYGECITGHGRESRMRSTTRSSPGPASSSIAPRYVLNDTDANDCL